MALLIGDIATRATLMLPEATTGSLGSRAVSVAQLDEGANRTARALYGVGVRRAPRLCGKGCSTARLFRDHGRLFSLLSLAR